MGGIIEPSQTCPYVVHVFLVDGTSHETILIFVNYSWLLVHNFMQRMTLEIQVLLWLRMHSQIRLNK